MSTTVTQVTKSKQILTRTLSDIDPKVRAAIGVFAADALVAVPSYLLGAISVRALAAALLPVLVAIIAAYVTTSTHKDLIIEGLKTVTADAAVLGPELAAAKPATGPAVQAVEDGLGLLEQALTPETTDLAKVTAGVTDPTPATAVIQAAVLPTPVQ